MSVAVVQGCSGSLGYALTGHLLRHTGLTVYALTHRAHAEDLSNRLVEDFGHALSDRLTFIEKVDVTEEEGLERAARTIGAREGKGSVRLIACMAGILHPEKSLSAIDPQSALDSFRINTLGHLLTYKHLAPLIPSKKEFAKLRSKWSEESDGKERDPARGLVNMENSLCFSLSARVGSIADNERGGWYSYRASKSALNQVVRTLDHELINRSSSAIAVGYHPGTVLTSFTAPILGPKATPNLDKGVFDVGTAIGHMTDVMGRVSRSDTKEQWGGRCWDWRQERIEW